MKNFFYISYSFVPQKMFASTLLFRQSFSAFNVSKSSSGSVLKNTFSHAKALSSFSSLTDALRISKITSNSYNITSNSYNIKLQKYNKLLSPSFIRFKNTSTSEKELNDNIFVSDELYDALEKRFQGNEDTKINHVRQFSQAEIKFLHQRGICYNGNNLKQLKESILNNANDKKIWVDRCKELSFELNVCELEAKIPDILDLFRQIVGSDHYDILMNILRNAFALKTTVDGTNSDWDIFAFRKTDEGQWLIAIFRIKALRINDQWDLYFFKWGKNVIKVDFLGYHLRPFDETTQ